MPTKQKQGKPNIIFFLPIVAVLIIMIFINAMVLSLIIKEQTTPSVSLNNENEIIWNYFSLWHNNKKIKQKNFDKLRAIFTDDAKFIDKTDAISYNSVIPINLYLKYADSAKIYIEDFSILETKILTITDSVLTKRVKIKSNVKLAHNKKGVNYFNIYFTKNKKNKIYKIYKIENAPPEINTTNLNSNQTYRVKVSLINSNGQEISNKRPEIQSISNELIDRWHGNIKNHTITLDDFDLEEFLKQNKNAIISVKKREIIIRDTIQLSKIKVIVRVRDIDENPKDVNLSCLASNGRLQVHEEDEKVTPVSEKENTFNFQLVNGYTYVFRASKEYFKTKDTTFTIGKTMDNNELIIELLPIIHNYEIIFTGNEKFMNKNVCPLPEKMTRTIPDIYFFDYQYDSLLKIGLNSEYWIIKGDNNTKVSFSQKKYHIPVIRKSSKQKLQININREKSWSRKKIRYTITDFYKKSRSYKQSANTKTIPVFFPEHPYPDDYFSLVFYKPLGFNITLDGDRKNKNENNDTLVLNKTKLSKINLTLTKLKPLNIIYIDLYGMSADEKRQALKKIMKKIESKVNKTEIIYLFFVNNREPETLSSIVGKPEKINDFFSSVFLIQTSYTPYQVVSPQLNRFVENAVTKFPRNSLYFYYFVSNKTTDRANYIISLKNDMNKYKNIIDLQ